MQGTAHLADLTRLTRRRFLVGSAAAAGGLPQKQKGRAKRPFFPDPLPSPLPRERESSYSSGTISSATMLMILISGFTAGPAVSL